MDYMALSAAEWQQEYDKGSAEYESWKAKGLKLNMARGKPSKQQLDLVSGILTALTSAEECVDSGVDARNYGELKGLESARKLFADILGCKTSQVFAGGNSSLQLMYDTVSKAYTHGLLHSEKPWCKEESVKWLCPAPGYDRHFAITEEYGFELISVPMTPMAPIWTLWRSWWPRMTPSRASGACPSIPTRMVILTAMRPLTGWPR